MMNKLESYYTKIWIASLGDSKWIKAKTYVRDLNIIFDELDRIRDQIPFETKLIALSKTKLFKRLKISKSRYLGILQLSKERDKIHEIGISKEESEKRRIKFNNKINIMVKGRGWICE